MDDLETMACPPKYRALNTFYKYYSGEAQVSERTARGEAQVSTGTTRSGREAGKVIRSGRNTFDMKPTTGSKYFHILHFHPRQSNRPLSRHSLVSSDPD